MALPSEAVAIGADNWILPVEYEGETCGVQEYHRNPAGQICAGWVAFKGASWDRAFAGSITSWDVIKLDPLTLQPSILCRACGNHGYITEGRWVKA